MFEVAQGAVYDTFLYDAEYFSHLADADPHYVVAVMGGNDVGSWRPLDKIKRDMREFFHRIKFHAPNALIIAAQVENRDYEPHNVWGAPAGEDYHRKRSRVNTFLRDLENKDFLAIVGGPNNLDDLSLYRDDQVHLKPENIPKYWEIIENCLHFVHRTVDHRLARERALRNVGRRQRERRGNVRDRLD